MTKWNKIPNKIGYDWCNGKNLFQNNAWNLHFKWSNFSIYRFRFYKSKQKDQQSAGNEWNKTKQKNHATVYVSNRINNRIRGNPNARGTHFFGNVGCLRWLDDTQINYASILDHFWWRDTTQRDTLFVSTHTKKTTRQTNSIDFFPLSYNFKNNIL